MDFVLSRGRFFKPNRTRRLAAEAVRILIEDIGKPPGERRALAYPWFGEARLGLAGFKWPPDAAGNEVLYQLIGGLGHLEGRRALGDAGLLAARTIAALRAFQVRSGKLPATLAELVPGTLEAVPLDPFDGKPLRYSRDKKILWSVGIDLEDSGGAVRNEDGEWEPDQGREPTFPIEF